MAAEYRRSNRKAFTLVELLVVVGIIALLIAILLPTLASARASARRTTCASRLRSLAIATGFYNNEFRRIPPCAAFPALQSPVPSGVTAQLLDQHLRYIAANQKPLDPNANLSAAVPDLAVCPARQIFDLFDEPDVSTGTPCWITGYMYLGPMASEKPRMGVVADPSRCTNLRGTARGVIWADTLLDVRLPDGSVSASAFHLKGAIKPTPAGTLNQDAVEGQHRGWTDGSVEWVVDPLSRDPYNKPTPAPYILNLAPGLTYRFVY